MDPPLPTLSLAVGCQGHGVPCYAKIIPFSRDPVKIESDGFSEIKRKFAYEVRDLYGEPVQGAITTESINTLIHVGVGLGDESAFRRNPFIDNLGARFYGALRSFAGLNIQRFAFGTRQGQ